MLSHSAATNEHHVEVMTKVPEQFVILSLDSCNRGQGDRSDRKVVLANLEGSEESLYLSLPPSWRSLSIFSVHASMCDRVLAGLSTWKLKA